MPNYKHSIYSTLVLLFLVFTYRYKNEDEKTNFLLTENHWVDQTLIFAYHWAHPYYRIIFCLKLPFGFQQAVLQKILTMDYRFRTCWKKSNVIRRNTFNSSKNILPKTITLLQVPEL